ncbi:MAG: tol-pal system protein YbgF [Burkholderiaceae bacterium]|nr:tol-pal system protein YbgF [Burkholderiaceae bacterium]
MSVFSLPMRTTLLATIVAVSTMFVAPAHAFADDEARRAILDLRAQIQQMSEQNRQARLQLADQMETLQHEMASMRGQLEKLNWESDLTKRSSQDQATGNAAQVADPQEQAAYEGPIGLFRSGKYKEAASDFQTFLDAYPNSQLAPEARFYQGSSRYASKDFKGAITGLQDMIKTTPQDPRAADALLVIAASQIELNNMAGAKTSLQQIVKDYPQTSAAETAKSRLKLL